MRDRPMKLTEPQERDLRDVATGLSRGESPVACEALVRKGMLRGDWITGYYLTANGQRWIKDHKVQ